MTIKVLETKKKQIHDDVVDLIETLLERAKAGEVVSVGLIAIDADGGVAVATSMTDNYHQLVAGTVYLQNSMCRK
jgi:isoaspartyl peptidase/L-asparaginase-like protein (Ntn-hydrolase superfamily)